MVLSINSFHRTNHVQLGCRSYAVLISVVKRVSVSVMWSLDSADIGTSAVLIAVTVRGHCQKQLILSEKAWECVYLMLLAGRVVWADPVSHLSVCAEENTGPPPVCEQ